MILGNIEDKRRRGAAEDEIDSIINTVNMNLSKLQEIVGNAEVYGVPMSWTRFRDWTTAKIDIYNCTCLPADVDYRLVESLFAFMRASPHGLSLFF